MALTTVTALETSYQAHVNPQWVRLLDLLQMNASYARCEGVELDTTDGRRILDFLSGYCVHNVGHNHPRIIAALKDELDARGPAMLQSHVPSLAENWPNSSASAPAAGSPRPSSAAPAAKASSQPSSSRARPPAAPDCSLRRAPSMDSLAAHSR